MCCCLQKGSSIRSSAFVSRRRAYRDQWRPRSSPGQASRSLPCSNRSSAGTLEALSSERPSYPNLLQTSKLIFTRCKKTDIYPATEETQGSQGPPSVREFNSGVAPSFQSMSREERGNMKRIVFVVVLINLRRTKMDGVHPDTVRIGKRVDSWLDHAVRRGCPWGALRKSVSSFSACCRLYP